MQEIVGKVIAIVSTTGLVINRGSRENVKEGMVFAIHLVLPRIADPEDPTNALDDIFFEKGRMIIGAVFERMAFGSLVGQPYQVSGEFVWNTRYPSVAGERLVKDTDWLIREGDRVVLVEEPKPKTKPAG